ncbi:MAG: phospho-N-acetylmuramoyl-pentapeptide-transferase [Candidatus Saccharimonadales bacterium]
MEINTSAISPELIIIVATTVGAFILSILLTPIYTTLAFRWKAWKRVRDTAITGEKAKIFHKLHAEKHKRNIPTMAGVIFVVTIALITLLFNLSREQTWLPLFALVAAGGVGLVDDLINIRGGNGGLAGMRSKVKFLLVLLIAGGGAWYFFFKLGYSSIYVPFLGQQWELGWLLIPLFILVFISTANAVNITDGLDGLSGGLLAQAFGAYAVIAFLQGNFGIAAFCGTVVGALLSYTWFNIHPARFFMGDVGSFSMGAALAVVAMLTDTVLLLPIIGGMFVIEAGSSLVQILSKKYFGRKIFLSAPVHHHFEARGWPETKVTMRFWILGAVFTSFGLLVAFAGGVV